MYEDNELLEVVRRQNRALRKIHKVLRSAVKSSKEYSDELFTELCNLDHPAIEALERIRFEGDLKCEPDDYEYIIFECLQALKEIKERV